MASYQIPQFLDSGDKILGPLNVRQFAYAMGGGFISVLIFTVTSSLVQGLGNYAIIPAIPILGLSAYLALGKYNGRDSEVYVLKSIIYLLKPRIMKFSRIIDVSDLDSRLSELTVTNIEKKWAEAASKAHNLEGNEYATFEMETSKLKAQKLRTIGSTLDLGQRNALEAIQRGTIKIQQSSQQIQAMSPKKPGYSQPHIINQTPVAPLSQTQIEDNANYFAQ